MADEINRTPPKTQAALLQAMQEHKVTSGGNNYDLVEPFFVLATQNPIEQEGTYPLPEAQVDRFMFKLLVNYPNIDSEKILMRLNTSASKKNDVKGLVSIDMPYPSSENNEYVPKITLKVALCSNISGCIPPIYNPACSDP